MLFHKGDNAASKGVTDFHPARYLAEPTVVLSRTRGK
jgi:hypothetical protein